MIPVPQSKYVMLTGIETRTRLFRFALGPVGDPTWLFLPIWGGGKGHVTAG